MRRRQRRLKPWPTAIAALLVAIAATAGALAITAAADRTTSSPSKPPRTSVPTTAPTASVPTTPTTTAPPTTFFVGIRTVVWVNPTGVAVNPVTHQSSPRTLTTQIRYPTLDGTAGTETTDAPPAVRYGPYPVVVFAHGFNTDPSTYRALLDHWVSAGFVVVAPVFPEENAANIAALGGPSSVDADLAEGDLRNEPSDIAYVVSQIAAWAGSSPPAAPPNADASFLRGLADPSRIALAGQSDGGDAVAGLAFASAYRSLYSGLAIVPRAVLVMSGAPIPGVPATYATPTPAPDTLIVQSATDECNLPQLSTALYNDLGAPKWFLELDNATHLGPYVGTGPAAPTVQEVTTEFLDMALGRGSVTAADLGSSLSGSTVASITSGASAPPIAALAEPSPSAVVQACAP